MCIFNNYVRELGKTKILVTITETGRQLTIYQNSITGDQEADSDKKPKHDFSDAMILPYPIAGNHGEPVVLIDLSGDDRDILDDLAYFFDRLINGPPALRLGGSTTNKLELLPVKELGAYNVSIARSIEDLHRIDKRVFKINPSIADLLKIHYGRGFGFLVCSYNSELGVKEHPIAYIHDLLPNYEYFIPTRHEHGSRPWFNHVIFTINADPRHSASFMAKEDQREIVTDILQIEPLKEILPSMINVRVRLLKGELENEDLLVPIDPTLIANGKIYLITKGPHPVAIETSLVRASAWQNCEYHAIDHSSSKKLLPTMYVIKKSTGEPISVSGELESIIKDFRSIVSFHREMDDDALKFALLGGYAPGAESGVPSKEYTTYFLTTVVRA